MQCIFLNKQNFFFITLVTPLLALTGCKTTSAEISHSVNNMQNGKNSSTITVDFALKDIEGKTAALSDFLYQKVVVITFFATWCEPCKKELIELNAIFNKYRQDRLIVLAISMDLPESRSEVRSLAKKLALSYPVLLDDDFTAVELFNQRREAPFTLVINIEGKNTWSHSGYVFGDEKILEKIIIEELKKVSENSSK